MKVTLTVHGEEKDGDKFEFTKPSNLLFGRSERAQCRIVNDPYVSRIHFLLLINPPEVRLRNLSQTNGTEVDGVLYTQSTSSDDMSEAQTLVKTDKLDDTAEAILRNGSEIEVGYTKIEVAIDVAKECHGCRREISSGEEKASTDGKNVLCSDCLKRHVKEEELRRFAARKKEHEAQHLRQQALNRQVKPAEHSPMQKLEDRRARRFPVRAAFSPTDQPAEMIRNIIRQLRISELKGTIPSIPGYEVLRTLEIGGMGLILEAKRVRDGHKTAIKVVKPDRRIDMDMKRRFKREIRITKSLRHLNIIEVIDDGEANGLFWFAMEFVEKGYDIAKHIKARRGRIPIQEAIELTLQSLDALAYAHARSIVHRDLKPANILLASKGSGYIAKITDFSIAKSLEDLGLNGSILTKPQACMGTLPYMPPEQVIDVRKATFTADVFSMGAMLYQMLTGQLVRNFSRNQNEAIRQVVQDNTIPIQQRGGSINPKLASVINKSLDLDPNLRYANGGEFKMALEAVVS
jgi:serine/threonine-protein kinase